MSSIAFVLGNGESRRGIEINDLMEKGTVFACNAVYRTHRPHFLIAVDPKMILEIAETDYMLHNKVWSNFNAQYNKNPKILDPTALRMACEHGFKEIYLLGFDYQGHKDGKRFKLNNLFGDSRNYKKRNEEATFYGNWMNQTKRCLQDFKDVRFHRVIPTGWFRPKDIEWHENMDHPTTEEFLSKFDLQIKI